MSQVIDPRAWWNLHLRKARGEHLSRDEEQVYDAEAARQDREAPPLTIDLASLKQLRDQLLALGQLNAERSRRLAALTQEIQRAEQALSRETREALGVGK